MQTPADIMIQYEDERGNTIIRRTHFRRIKERDYTNPELVYDPRSTTFPELDDSWPLADD